MRPQALSVCSITFTQFSVVRSAVNTWHAAPLAFNSACSLAAAAASRPVITGIAPSSAHARTIAAPIPFAPPVTSTTLSLSCRSMFSRVFHSSAFYAVKPCGVDAEYPVLFCRLARQEFRNEAVSPGITACQQAYRPVGSEHQPVRAEAMPGGLEVRPAIIRLPVLPVSLGGQSRQLAEHVGQRSELMHLSRPWLQLSRLDLRLRDVVENESLVGIAFRQLDGRWQLTRIDKDVVAETEPRKTADAAAEFCAKHELLVRLALHDVAETAEFFKGAETCKPFLDIRRGQVDPADHADD